MKKMLMLALMLVAVTAMGDVYTCDFENGELPLGYYGDGDPPMICEVVTAPDPVYAGDFSLRCIDNAAGGTPQALMVWIKGLQDGDVINAGFYRFDDTPGESPSIRIWGHWNDDPLDITGYSGSAGGNGDYGEGLGWDYHDWTWTVEAGHTGLIIEARTYSSEGDTAWIDDLYVDAPAHAEVIMPEGNVATGQGTWSQIKALY